MGTSSEINALARMATRRGEPGFSVDELSKYLSDLKVVGGNAAVARAEYAKEAKRLAMKGGLNAIRRENVKMNNLQKAAKLSEQEANAALNSALNDDLVKLLDNTAMGASKDPAQNTKWGYKLLGSGKENAKNFMTALENSGRVEQANLIRRGVASDVMRGLLDTTPAGGRSTNPTTSNMFFFSEGGTEHREAFKSIVGRDIYDNIMSKVVKPLQKIYVAQSSIGQKRVAHGELANLVRGQASVGPLRFYTPLQKLMSYAQNGRYNTAYHLYVDPVWAPRYEKAGQNIDRFVAQSPVNALALRLWSEEDDKTQGQQGTN